MTGNLTADYADGTDYWRTVIRDICVIRGSEFYSYRSASIGSSRDAVRAG
jgi:hypothetical protein